MKHNVQNNKQKMIARSVYFLRIKTIVAVISQNESGCNPDLLYYIEQY